MKIGLCFCLLICLIACSEKPLYEQTYELSSDGWAYDDEQVFTFTSQDSLSTFDIILDIVHEEAYAYENLYILINTTFPDGQIVEDQISIPFIGTSGAWQGRPLQDDRLLRVYLQQEVRLQQLGTYTITIEQHSRERTLQGIKRLHLSLLPVAN